MSGLRKEEISRWFKELQDHICRSLEETDTRGTFREDNWAHPQSGGGRSRIIENGEIIEKGGVNFSAVEGDLSEVIRTALDIPEARFFATGVSIVMHPQNPFVPIIHMNVRYFELSNGDKWFGGGIDLTPHYVDKEQAKTFHRALKITCDRFDPSYYAAFKKWADDYFFIKHRNETRGIGGIFFDRLGITPIYSLEARFEFVKAIGELFAPVYTSFMKENHSKFFGEREKKWQMLRRGRYAEFNLVYDKGTKFGFETGGRTESILMSLPPQAHWDYQVSNKPGSPEEETQKLLAKGIEWASE